MQEQTAILFSELSFSKEYREDYSGRAMHGATTFAVTFDSMPEAIEALVIVSFDAGEDGDSMVMEDLVKIRFDEMAHLPEGVILY